MLSKQDVYTTLRDSFVCLRLDWEQGNHFKERFGFVLGTGDQLILDPSGQVIPPPNAPPGRNGILYGRHGCDTTGEILTNILADHPPKPGSPDLRMDWFFWETRPTRRPGGNYPASPEAIAGFARLPLAIVEGPLSAPLLDPIFLGWHVRQFIWVRGSEQPPARIRVRRVRDGLPEGLPTQLADLDGTLDAVALGQGLDQAWLIYMKDRPRVAGGYLENQHGRWMRGLSEQFTYEDEEVRKRAEKGTLLAPGRKAGAPVLYSPRRTE